MTETDSARSAIVALSSDTAAKSREHKEEFVAELTHGAMYILGHGFMMGIMRENDGLDGSKDDL